MTTTTGSTRSLEVWAQAHTLRVALIAPPAAAVPPASLGGLEPVASAGPAPPPSHSGRWWVGQIERKGIPDGGNWLRSPPTNPELMTADRE
jgi:hypothetical protein